VKQGVLERKIAATDGEIGDPQFPLRKEILVRKTAKVLMIYTGGTIGMLPKDVNDPSSPLVPVDWERIRDFVPSLRALPIEVSIWEMEPIDSSDMHPDYWVKIARAIRDAYESVDGFVILHGTDTMAYTASALSFRLDNLERPVIITGSRVPLAAPDSDAVRNLQNSLKIACPAAFGLPVVPEVCICFDGLLLRGNRARKVGGPGPWAFQSPNFPLLGEVGETIRIHSDLVRKPAGDSFCIHERIDAGVLMLDLFPGIDAGMLDTIFGLDGLRGVVLKTFGSGNGPTSSAFLRVVARAVQERNLVIVNVTQCVVGRVDMGRYDAGVGLLDAGVVSGADMTPEAALVKLQFLLGTGADTDTVKRLMQTDLCGELTPTPKPQRLFTSPRVCRAGLRRWRGAWPFRPASRDRVLP